MASFASRMGRDIKSFVGGKDLVALAIGLALSTQFQLTVKAVIDATIMPFVSKLTGATKLSSRKYDIGGDIEIEWGKALESLVVFFITLIVMVQIARYITVNYVKSTSVSFN